MKYGIYIGLLFATMILYGCELVVYPIFYGCQIVHDTMNYEKDFLNEPIRGRHIGREFVLKQDLVVYQPKYATKFYLDIAAPKVGVCFKDGHTEPMLTSKEIEFIQTVRTGTTIKICRVFVQANHLSGESNLYYIFVQFPNLYGEIITADATYLFKKINVVKGQEFDFIAQSELLDERVNEIKS